MPEPFTVLDRLFREEPNWFMMIKELRVLYGVSIHQAEKMALAHAGWRRWCNLRINSDPQCRKYAFNHMRHNGLASLIERADDRFRVVEG